MKILSNSNIFPLTEGGGGRAYTMWLVFQHIICDAEENEVAFPKTVFPN